MFQQFVNPDKAFSAKTGYDIAQFEMAEDDFDDQSKRIIIVEENIRCDTTDYIVIAIFWGALLLNSSAQVYGNQPSPNDPSVAIFETNDPTQAVFETIASILYGVNVVFLIFQGIPCVKGSVLRGRCCSCSCRSREYAISSAIFFAFSIGSTITSFVYLG